MGIKKFYQFIFEELEVKDTYFTKSESMLKEVETEFQKIINQLSQKHKIKLPIESYSKDFILLKEESKKLISKNQIISKYIDNDTKKIDKLLLKYCSNVSDNKSKNKVNKLNITHLDFKLIDHVNNIETYQVIFPEDIKNYIFNNFEINKLDLYIYIKCESNNFNRIHFPGRIVRWYRSHGSSTPNLKQPQPYIGRHGKSIYDLLYGIPKTLRGTGLGYAIYKEFIKFKGYLSSNSWSISSSSQAVWKKLAKDPDFYGILINYKGQDGDILLFSKDFKGDYKKISNDYINKAKSGKFYKGSKDEFKVINIDIDDELKSKIA